TSDGTGAFASYHDQLLIGGNFATIAGAPSPALAYWMCPCYPDCDHSPVPPRLSVMDFVCFLNRYTANDPYANCDSSTTPPVLNVSDFACFVNAFTAGCP